MSCCTLGQPGPGLQKMGGVPFQQQTVGARRGCKGYLRCSRPISCILGCAYVHACECIRTWMCACVSMNMYMNVQSDAHSAALASFLWVQRDHAAVFGSLVEVRVFISTQADCASFLFVYSDQTHWTCVCTSCNTGDGWTGGLFCCGPCRPPLPGISTRYAAKTRTTVRLSLPLVVLRRKTSACEVKLRH